MTGTASTFGGASDATMAHDTGLAFYEPWEANLRPDLFLPAPADNPLQETWKRLRTGAMYCALRVPNEYSRAYAHLFPWKITNPATKQFVFCWLVDRGPGVLSRLVDLSPGAATALRIDTDKQEVEVEWR